MDVEHLSRSQIILLALLCTFVASIATAIVTVSLLAQAPPAVPQTINHIIQRTVEAVAPSGNSNEPAATVKETTVVVKEDELLSSTIASSFAKLGVVHEGVASSSQAVALGTLIAGVLVTDSTLVSEKHLVMFGDKGIIFLVKTEFPEIGLAVLVSENEVTLPASLRVADASQVQLGASVVALPSAAGTRVGIGAVTARYNLSKIVREKEETTVRALDTNMTGKMTPGAPLLSAFGDVIGIATSVSQGISGGPGTFVALSDVTPLILGVKGTTTPALPASVTEGD